MTTTADITVVTGRRTCRACEYVNDAGNEYCFHCGAPMGSVPEIIGDPSLAAQNRVSWQVYGVDTRMTGRDRELEHLIEHFRSVIETGHLRATVLLGAVGLGKSRLIDEFSRVINTRFGNALLISGAWRDSSEGAYAIVDRVLRNRFYIPERLPLDEARQRLLEGIRGIVKNPVALEIAHRVGALVNLPFPDSPFGTTETPDEYREASWRALAKLMRTDAAANPLVVVLEDMHHANDESLELIPYLAGALADCPIMCVFSASPDLVRAQPRLFAELPDLERMELRPLADDDVRSIVEQVLDRTAEIPDVLYRRVCDNAMGNPWIAEEILRILMSQGAIDTSEAQWRVDEQRVAEIHLPRGVDDVVQAALGLLNSHERALLEQAAVVGDTFWVGPITVIAHNAVDVPHGSFIWEQTERGEDEIIGDLQRLADKDLVRRREEARYPNEIEYAFKHAAVRRSLLEHLDDARARGYHELIAQWHELNRARGFRELDAVIAEHHRAAGHLGRAAYAYMAAARSARDQYDNRRALSCYLTAHELFDDSHCLQQIEILHEIGGLYDLIGEYEKAIPVLEQMLQLSWRLASLGKGGAAHNKLGRVLRSLGRYTEANSHFDHALNLFRRANDRAGIASTLDDIGKVHWIRGDYRAALELYKKALSLRRELGDRRSLALSLNHLGSLMVHLGDFKTALKHLREGLALRKKTGDRRGVADSLNSLGVILAERGDQEGAIALWQEAVDVTREIGDRVLEGVLLNNMGEVACQLGRLDDAESFLGAAVQISDECAEQRLLFDVMRNLGHLELRRNQLDRALERIEASLAVAKRLASRSLEGIALRSLAEVHAHRLVGAEDADQHIAAAEDAFRAAIAVLEDVGQEGDLGRTYLSYGTFLTEQGLFGRAKKHLAAARDIFARLGMKRFLAKTDELLSQL